MALLSYGKSRRNPAALTLFTYFYTLKTVILPRFLRRNMPILPKIPSHLDRIRQIHRQHPRRRPAVNQPGIGRVSAIGIPDRQKMCPPPIGTEWVFLKPKPCLVSPPHPLQYTPVVLIIKFWKVGDGVLGFCHRMALIGAHPCCHDFLDAISGLQCISGSGRGFLIRMDFHLSS